MLGERMEKAAMDLRGGASLDVFGAMARFALPLAEAMRSIQNSPLQQALKSIEQQQSAMCRALKPIEDIARAHQFLAESPLLHDIGRTAQAIRQFESHFRLPALVDLGRLAADFEASSVSKMLASFAEESCTLQRAMERMATPWLHTVEAMRSVAGFAELQGIGRALESMSGFDDALSRALRADLGDWRDPISWRPELLIDLGQRADFYAELGFNHDLTAFPASAFAESLDISGLRSAQPRLVARYGAPVPFSADEDEEEGFERASLAYDWLQRLETNLRAFIDEHMTEAFGVDWPKHRLPNGIYDQWREKRRKAQEAGAAGRPLIAYADFTDYLLVICRSDNWRQVFGAFFRRQESVRESLQRLYPIRLDTMHARPITQDDELLLYVEVRRLVKMIRGD